MTVSDRSQFGARPSDHSLPEEVLNGTPKSPVKMERIISWTRKHLRILLDDVVITELLFEVHEFGASDFASRDVSRVDVRTVDSAKQDGGVWHDRVHTEAVGGKNTCKQIKAAMLTRLSKMRKLLPFVRLSYAELSTHTWFDEKGERHVVNQADCGEQGKALMPLLFSIGIQGALEVVAGQLQDGDHVFAFLDDVNFLCQPHLVHTLHGMVEAVLWGDAGIANHTMHHRFPGFIARHDEGIWSTAKQLMLIDDVTNPECQQLASLTMRMGVLRLGCVLGIVDRRVADDQRSDVTSLSSAVPRAAGCLAELHEAAAVLDQQGFWWRPSWTELWQGKRPDSSEARDPGEWQHGWKYWASSVCDSSFRKTTMLTNRPASRRAHLRSHSGRNAGIAFAHCRTAHRVHDFPSLLPTPFSPPTCFE